MDHIKKLMQKEMTRKEFLTTLAFGVATLIGLSSLLGILGKTNPWDRQNSALGYGNGPYGGGKSLGS